MRFVVDLAYLLVALIISPFALYRAVRHKRYRKGWSHRFGDIHRRDPSKRCIWLHAVSVGEVNAARTIISELKAKFNDIEIVVSATTDTGFTRAQSLFGNNHAVFFFPLDFSLAIKRAFSNIRPDMCLLMELEVWPNFTHYADKLGVPVVVINGRISDRGFARYRIARPFVGGVFGKVSLVLAQTEQYASRFRELGCPNDRVIVTGSLKYDTAQIADKIEGTDLLASQIGLDKERLWVAGGTGTDEEKLLLEVFENLKQDDRFADLRLAIVPRKPERFNEVAQLIEARGLSLVRYSRVKEAGCVQPVDKQAVILGDTMGDLRKFYSLATIIFVGRSLVPMGGSDMMEAAALGRCTIVGPHAFNFIQAVDALIAGKGAIVVKNTDELLETMRKCLLDTKFASTIAANGQQVIRSNQGATQRSIEHIVGILGNRIKASSDSSPSRQ